MLLHAAPSITLHAATPRATTGHNSAVHSTPLLSREQCRSSSSNSSLLTACHALQNLLTSSLPSMSVAAQPRPVASASLEGPIDLHKLPLNPSKLPSTKPEHGVPVPKRRRQASDDGAPLFFEDSNEPHVGQELATAVPQVQQPSTPKRQRCCPPSLPLGLGSADFNELEQPHQQQQHPTFEVQQTPGCFAMPLYPCTSNQRASAETPITQSSTSWRRALPFHIKPDTRFTATTSTSITPFSVQNQGSARSDVFDIHLDETSELDTDTDEAKSESDRDEAITPPSPPATAAKAELSNLPEDLTWAASDAENLTATLLSKFRLRPSDWDDSANKLTIAGRRRNSVGQRWSVLVGNPTEVPIKLRRSSGLQRRMALYEMQ